MRRRTAVILFAAAALAAVAALPIIHHTGLASHWTSGRFDDAKPHWGGAGISPSRNGGHNCTSGFTVEKLVNGVP